MRKIRSFFDFLLDVVKDRNMLWQLAKNDFKARFAASFLGGMWGIIQPIFSLLVMWFVFEYGLKSGGVKGVPFIVWLAPAQLAWSFFSDGLMSGTNCLIEYNYLVKKVNFRVSMLPIVKVLSAMFVHAALILFIFVILFCNNVSFSIYNIQVLYYWFCTCILLIGLSWLLASLAPFVKDVVNVIGVLMQVGFWITPIFWSVEDKNIPPVALMIIKANPMFYVCRGYRDAFIDHVWFWERGRGNIVFWVITMFVFVYGANLFHKLRPRFADVL